MLFNNMGLFKRKKKVDENEIKADSINYKFTICERCTNEKCSSVGERNIFHGYNIDSCKSYKGLGKEEEKKKHPYDDYDNDAMAYPFGYDPNYVGH